MKIKTKILIIVLLVFIAAFSAMILLHVFYSKQKHLGTAFIININNKENVINYNKIIPPSLKRARDIKEIPYKLKFSLGGLADSVLLLPGQLRTINDKYLYITDFGDFKIKTYDSLGNYIKQVGRKGKGPGEFLNLQIVMLSNNNYKFAVIDNRIRRISFFSNLDTLIYNTENIATFDVAVNNNQNFFLLQNLMKENGSFISEYNFSGKKIKGFENIFDFSKISILPLISIILNGKIFLTNDYLIYVPVLLNKIFLFDFKGKLIRTISTIDDDRIPELYVTGYRTDYKRLWNKYILNFNVIIINKVMYIVSIPARKKFGGIVLDRYDINSWKYIDSWRFDIDKKVGDIFLTKNRLYLIDSKFKVSVYDYDVPAKK